MNDIREILLRQPNYRLMFMDEPTLREELKKWCRQDLIDWLSWYDPNGIYEDEDSYDEFERILSYEEGIELVVKKVTTYGEYTNRYELQKMLLDMGLLWRQRY